MTEANIVAVKTMIKGDTQYTIRDTARYVGITSVTAFKTLTEHLGLRKLCAHALANKGAKGLSCRNVPGNNSKHIKLPKARLSMNC